MGLRATGAWVALAAMCVGPAASSAGSQDPNTTATIYVHGFERTGAERHGVFGDDVEAPLADSAAAWIGLPTAGRPDGTLPPNVVVGTTYYGDTPPSYYTAADRAQLDSTTVAWGGGVPRYATIVAKFARHVLQRSGVRQINIISASFGSLIARWLIEKNVEGLAGEGRIARWLTVEGVVAGNWPASHPDVAELVSAFQPELIDLRHMSYDWVETNLHTPRTEADDARYGDILVGAVGSTDDSGNDAALRTAMLLDHDYHPNDGLQALPDVVFQSMTERSRFSGLEPTLAVFHATHTGLANVRAAWAEAATFLTASRRVTVTMTSAQVWNLSEPRQLLWNWLPAEILFESRVDSPAAQTRWSLSGPLSARIKEGAAAPLHRYRAAGETQSFSDVIFDDFVLPEEKRLQVDLRAVEVDNDPRYGVYETIQTPSYDDLGGGTVNVSTVAPGTYSFAVPGWDATLSVSIHDYPFPALARTTEVATTRAPGARALALAPNPFRSRLRITAPGATVTNGQETATLEIADLSGRIVRRIVGRLDDGFEWDGRDAQGRSLPTGIYLHRIAAPGGVWFGRSCLLR